MKTTFSRTFSTAATILLLAVLLLGTSFRLLVKDYLTDNTFQKLQKDAQVISNLATAYTFEGSLSGRNFVLILNIAGEISEVYLAQDADLFIVRQVKDACNQAGVRIVEVDTMKQLGEACGVEVKTASAGIRR